MSNDHFPDRENKPASQKDTEAQAVEAPLCRNLRSKKFLTLRSIPVTAAEVRDASNHCWCRCTMQVVGPDGRLVRPEQCGEGRSCYQSPFAV